MSSELQKDTSLESKETIRDLLVRLEKVVVAKNKAVDELKEKLYLAQEERFRSFQELANAKEQYLLNVVGTLQNKSQDKNDCSDNL